jgi:opacity protein-like surface antigen
MKTTIRAAAFVAAALLGAGAAAAQDRPVVSLAPADPARWDLAGHVGWLGSNKSDIGAEWNDWYNAASGGVTAGYYLTPHFKTDVQMAVSRQGRIYSQESIPVPGGAFPIFRSREHFFAARTFGAGVSHQFFENQWFHPFVGGGLEIVRETHRIDTPQQFIPGRLDPARPLVPAITQILPATTGTTDVSWAARPFIATGFKWYVAERGFVRSEVRSSFSRRGAEHVVWSGGAGIDF